MIIWERTGKKPAELETVELPEMMAHIWLWFCQLRKRVQPGFGGPNPITWSDLAAWAEMTGNRPTTFEVECITGLDDILLSQPQGNSNGS